MPKEYLIYCDESIEKGRYYSDFYGGVLVSSDYLHEVNTALEVRKTELNFFSEVKWTKVTANYLDKYVALMDVFFDFIQDGKIKVRIMFRQNAVQAKNLNKDHHDNKFFLLYYQFIKHAFGLRYSNPGPNSEEIYLRLFFDELPENKLKSETFKNQIFALQSLDLFQESNLKIRRRDIVDVDSKGHILLQCLDVVLGAMAFRLNDLHKEMPPGSKRRGKRTVAKEKVYKHLLNRIRNIYPNFNIGISTGKQGDIRNRWEHPYRHWSFIPREFEIDDSLYK